MKVGDLVKIKDTGWRHGGDIGIIVKSFPMAQTVKQKEENQRPYGFKVLLSKGQLISKLRKQMEVLSEN